MVSTLRFARVLVFALVLVLVAITSSVSANNPCNFGCVELVPDDERALFVGGYWNNTGGTKVWVPGQCFSYDTTNSRDMYSPYVIPGSSGPTGLWIRRFKRYCDPICLLSPPGTNDTQHKATTDELAGKGVRTSRWDCLKAATPKDGPEIIK